MSFRENCHVESIVLVLVVCVVGVYSVVKCPEKNEIPKSTSAKPIAEQEARFSWHDMILDEMKADNIKHELRLVQCLTDMYFQISFIAAY